MPNGNPKTLKPLIGEINTKLAALLDLFGSKEHVTQDLEILYGITSRAEFALAKSQVELINASLAQTTASTKALYESAKLVAKSSAAGA